MAAFTCFVSGMDLVIASPGSELGALRMDLELNCKNLGERIVSVARLATAMHLEEVLAMHAPLEPRETTQAMEAGGAGLWARILRARAGLTDEPASFTDEASCFRDEAPRSGRTGG